MDKKTIVVDMDNDYLKALMKSFHQFLIEECTGSINAELRLAEKLKAAKLLHHEEILELRKRPYFGRFNAGNVELIFKAKE
ncbi:MAG: hypothetical protein LBH12_06245 [Dysgonamonadaceae bacterium]|nr:hypothetical protein [Dysgonamonadaceae bacterium]